MGAISFATVKLCQRIQQHEFAEWVSLLWVRMKLLGRDILGLQRLNITNEPTLPRPTRSSILP
jgi:adenylosuccinate lyase